MKYQISKGLLSDDQTNQYLGSTIYELLMIEKCNRLEKMMRKGLDLPFRNLQELQRHLVIKILIILIQNI